MSLCRHLSAQEIIVNWVTTADGCVHTDDTTKLSLTSCEFVLTPPMPTRQNSFVPPASAVCIGHMTGALNLQDLKMTDQIAGRWQTITETKSQFWFWKMPTSNIMKILLSVHSAVNLQGRKIRIVCFSQTWNITSRHGHQTCVKTYMYISLYNTHSH